MDTTLLFGQVNRLKYFFNGVSYLALFFINQVGPIAILVALTFTLIEAAGAADYRRLPGTDQAQLFSAK